MVAPKSTVDGTPGGGGGQKGTFGAGYIAPHPSVRKDASDVDIFLREHEVYTQEYLESVQPVHHTPTKLHEMAAWYWHVAARTMVGLLTGTLWASPNRLTERSLGMRMMFFSSVGVVAGLVAAITSHMRSQLYNVPDNGWVHTSLANAECIRTHGAILANVTWAPNRPPIWARVFHLFVQVAMFFQLLPVYILLPSVASAYDAYRAEEQVFNYSQAIKLIRDGRLKRWKSAKAPSYAVGYYAVPEGTMMYDVLMRMRADEACIGQMCMVKSDLSPGEKNPFITMERKSK